MWRLLSGPYYHSNIPSNVSLIMRRTIFFWISCTSVLPELHPRLEVSVSQASEISSRSKSTILLHSFLQTAPSIPVYI